MSTDLDPQTAGAVDLGPVTMPFAAHLDMTPEPEPVAVVTRKDLTRLIHEYIVDSKAGDTLSYRETAMLDTEETAQSSAGHLWTKMERDGLVAISGELVEGEVATFADDLTETLLAMEFVAGEDLVAGQVCVLGDGNTLKGKPADVQLVDAQSGMTEPIASFF